MNRGRARRQKADRTVPTVTGTSVTGFPAILRSAVIDMCLGRVGTILGSAGKDL